jgi:hypothetical protein
MAGAFLPICEWCGNEPAKGPVGLVRPSGFTPLVTPRGVMDRPPIYRQELTQRTIDGSLVWLHLQCEQAYRDRDK